MIYIRMYVYVCVCFHACMCVCTYRYMFVHKEIYEASPFSHETWTHVYAFTITQSNTKKITFNILFEN